METGFDRYLNTLILWAEERGYFINFEPKGDNCICLLTKIVEINSKASIKKQFFCLLHECGHILVFENGSFWQYQEKTEPLHNQNANNQELNKNRKTYKVYTVIEEIEAWERAFKLAKRLNIPIEYDDWEKEMLNAIEKYIKWAAN
jgi:Zn-dependent peptidase ImmA (M78 family)